MYRRQLPMLLARTYVLLLLLPILLLVLRIALKA